MYRMIMYMKYYHYDIMKLYSIVISFFCSSFLVKECHQ